MEMLDFSLDVLSPLLPLVATWPVGPTWIMSIMGGEGCKGPDVFPVRCPNL